MDASRGVRYLRTDALITARLDAVAGLCITVHGIADPGDSLSRLLYRLH